jgi:formylglycine-generating enzyme required for sulfatase activity
VKLPTEAQWEKAARGPKAYTYPWGDDWNPRNCNWNGTWVAKYGMNPDPNKGVASDVWRAFMKSEKFNKEVVEKLGGLTAPVGSFPRGKSFYGCYDMAGNAYECCADWFKADYYKLKDAMRNPQGPNEEDADADTNVKDRVVRGGSWCNDPGDCRSFHRDRPHSSLTRPYTLGFRVVISASAQRSASAIPAPAQQTPASPPTQNVAQPPSTVKSYDDVYVTTAATGDKIPHPLSKKTYNLYYMGRAVKVPEGMVFVPAGEFIMGEGKEPPNGPEHKVWVDAYCIGKYEVTNAEWKLFMEANGENRPRYLMEGIPKGRENHPATYIGRHEAMRYSEWVSKETGSDVRLPTEAQWEKAARGKKAFIYPWGNDWDERFFSGSLSLAKAFGLASTYGPEFAKLMKEWPNTEKGKELLALGGVTCPVGSFPRDKSPYGCYDMAGNDLEWCSDWYKADYYVKSPKSNPQGPKEDEADMATIAGEKRRALVYRGGAWLLGNPKTWARGFTPTGNAVFSHGLRIVCLPEKK